MIIQIVTARDSQWKVGENAVKEIRQDWVGRNGSICTVYFENTTTQRVVYDVVEVLFSNDTGDDD